MCRPLAHVDSSKLIAALSQLKNSALRTNIQLNMVLSYPSIQDSPKRIRVLFAGQFIADTTKAKLVWEHPYYPAYFFPQSAIPSKYLRVTTPKPKNSPPHSETYDLVVGYRVSNAAVIKYDGSITGGGGDGLDVAGTLKVIFDRADAWFEEDEEIFAHPKDPYKVLWF